ncbi:MAG: ribosome small subunit-dependent GTPase A [Opitutaceae bacterium]|nr:ribosome small subunit-dependent GTPase A [Opitutaceae bacterium]
MKLAALGWDESFAAAFAPHAAAGLQPARVICELKHAYALHTGHDEILGECTGRLLHTAASRADLPAVGDWVAARPRAADPRRVDIHAVLPRRTKFSRREPHEPGVEQIIAANVDTVFLVSALDAEFNLRRIERYLAVAWESGAQPVIVLNKSDLCPATDARHLEVEAIAPGVPVVALSAGTGNGFAQLRPWLKQGRTLALLGSSGVGKSTLVNLMMRDDVQVTQETRSADDKGRHTTARRELFVAPSGMLIIDTPGLRELQIWEADIGDTFADIAELAARCKFRDCTHGPEPGCAVRAALEGGVLDAGRWTSFQKLAREQAFVARQTDRRAAQANKAKWKKLHLGLRARLRIEHGGD